jgi:hypothetical protein
MLRFIPIFSVVFAIGCAPPVPPVPGQDPGSAITSVDGEVVGVDRVSPSDRLASGVRVTLRPEGSPVVVVDLAPDWYLSERGLKIERADRMKVQGKSRGGAIVYARTVEASGHSVELRDAQGQPLWTPNPAE